MTGQLSQRGSAFVPAILLFIFVASLLIAATIGRTTFLARSSHHALLAVQAEWLAESTVEHAVSALAQAKDPSSVESKTFTDSIAPIFVGSDPLDPENGDPKSSKRILQTQCAYTIVPADPRVLGENGRAAFIVVGRCDIPYRGTVIERMKTHLCIQSKDGSWSNRPVSTESRK